MLKEKAPKTTRVGSLKKLLERVENGTFVLNRNAQVKLSGGLTEDDLTKEQLLTVLKKLIKEDEEKPAEEILDNKN